MTNYQLKCKDLGFDTCDFIATGNSDSELKRKFLFHTIISHEREFGELPQPNKNEIYDHMNRILEEQN